MSQIIFTEVTKEYGVGEAKQLALHNISFSIDEGEFVVILGPSGAGKTTILNLLGGMDSATSGSILVDSREITQLSDDALSEYRASQVGFVFQFYNLIEALTALENVSLIKSIVKAPLAPLDVLSAVGLSSHVDKFPSQLSGGEQQRVSIARAVAKNPLMLLCDEPTGALDSETGVSVLTLLQALSREHGKTVIIVTHNSALEQAADKVIRVKNGAIQSIHKNKAPAAISEVTW